MPNTMAEWIAESKQRIPEPIAERFNRGHWIAAYRIVGDIRSLTVHQLGQALSRIEHSLNPKPEFLNDGFLNRRLSEVANPPSVQFDVCTKICVFWRASPSGEFFIASAYGEDNHVNGIAPSLNPLAPAWRMQECLGHAAALASELSGAATAIQFRTEWHGLANRQLYLANRFEPSDMAHKAATEPAAIEATVSDVESNTAQLVQKLTADFYCAFGREYLVSDWLKENPNYRRQS